jgi:hypothetical protein
MRAFVMFTLGTAGLVMLDGCAGDAALPVTRQERPEVTAAIAYSSDGFWCDSDGKVTQDHLHQKVRDGFGAMIYLTPHKDFIESFERSPFVARLESPDSAHAGEKYYALLIIFGPGKDLNGHSFVTFTGRVRDPNEHNYQEYVDAIVLKETNTSPDARLRISNSRITLQFTHDSIPGEYVVDMVVTDHIKHVSLHLMQTVRLEAIRTSGHIIAAQIAEPSPLQPDDDVGAVD